LSRGYVLRLSHGLAQTRHLVPWGHQQPHSRTYEHKNKVTKGFTAQYAVDRLVWFECYDDPTNAIEREKEIKKWRRAWKVALIEAGNPDWKDLYAEITL
jgi:putative endonuclease